VSTDPAKAPAERKRKQKQGRRKPRARAPMPRPSSNGSEPEEQRGLRTWLGELSTTVKAVGAVAGAIAAIAGLVFVFVPDWRPDPTPDEGSATFSEPMLEQPVTYGQYLDRVEVPRDTSSPEELERPGVLVSVQVTIKGYRGQALPLRWFLLDGAEIVDQQSKRHTLTADRNNAPAAWSFWVERRPGNGPFKVVVQVFPPNAKPGRPEVRPLDEAATAPFPAPTA
jgi:hypothetical protein